MGKNGKSYAMIMSASQEGAVLFCANKESEKRYLEQAREIGVTLNTCVSDSRKED